MPDLSDQNEATRREAALFATTCWTDVEQAAGDANETNARLALEELCHRYWPPLYSFLRRQGHPPADAEDLTQGFFTMFLEKEYFGRATPERGRFRTFLLSSLKNFVQNQRRREQVLKRGGRCQFISLSQDGFEEQYTAQHAGDIPPDQAYDRTWAQLVLERAFSSVHAAYRQEGKLTLFKAIKPALWNELPTSYADLAKTLDLSESAIKMAVLRLRRRLRTALREEVMQTVVDPEEVEDELQYLLDALRA